MSMMRTTLISAAIALAVSLSGCSATQTTGKQPAENTQQQASGFKMPAYEQVQLSNGLTLMLMPQHEVPLITVNAVVRAGSIHDTSAGLASLTAKSLLLGNSLKSKADTELLIDSLGASLETQAGKEGSYISTDFMAKDAKVVLPLIKAVLLEPSFNNQEFDKLLQREVASLKRAKESPRAVISNYFGAQLFGDHPYGKATSGDTQSLAAISRDQVREFHQTFYQPGNTAITVAGDFEPAAMKAYLQQLFGDWQTTQMSTQVELNPAPAPTEAKVLLVDKPDAIETTFMIGGKGISRDDPDYVGLQVINTILGGRFTSWLNDELRVNSGLTYGARSAFIPYRDDGVFRISTFTQTATTDEAMALALKTYDKLWQQGIDQATLDSAKAYVKGQFPPKYETSGQLAGLMADMYLYGFDDDFINDFENQVNGLTLADSQRLIKQHFPRQNLQFVLIGNAAEIAPVAAKYGEVIQVDMTSPGFAGTP